MPNISSGGNKYVNSLVDYILDTKPYHVKLTSVVEEYQFFDTINIELSDRWSTQLFLEGMWPGLPASNFPGVAPIRPRSTYSLFSPGTGDPLTTVVPYAPRQFLGSSNDTTYESILDQDYQLGSNFIGGYSPKAFDEVGIKSVVIDSYTQLESVDYHISLGAFTFNIHADRQWVRADQDGLNITLPGPGGALMAPVPYGSGYLHYDEQTEPYGRAGALSWDPYATNYEEWTVTCTDTIATTYPATYTHNQVAASATWTINHPMLSRDLIWAVYTVDPSVNPVAPHLVATVPSQLHIIDESTVEVTFVQPESGQVVLHRHFEGGFTTRRLPVNLAQATWMLPHDLDTTDLLFAAYDENGYAIFPASTTLPNADLIELDYPTPVAGHLIIARPKFGFGYTYDQINPATSWTFQHDLNTTELTWSIQTFDGVELVPTLPGDINFPTPNTAVVTFAQPEIGRITVASKLGDSDELVRWTLSGSISGQVYVSPDVPPSFSHEQTTNSLTWTVAHDLNSTDLLWAIYVYDPLANPVAPHLVAIIPTEIRTVDVDTTILTFNTPHTGKAVVVRAFDGNLTSHVFNQATAATTWTFTHNLNTTELLWSVYDESNNISLPADVTFPTLNTVQVDFTSPREGKLILAIPHAGDGFVHTEPGGATTWNITHNLDSTDLVWAVQTYDSLTSSFVVTIPLSLVFPTPNTAVVTFSSLTAGHIVLAKAIGMSNEPAAGLSIIKFPYDQAVTTSTFSVTVFSEITTLPVVGDKFILTPTGVVTIHPSAPLESWSIIKTNPLAYTRPSFVGASLGKIEPVAYDVATPTQVWQLIAIGPLTFSVTGSVTGPTASATVGVPYSNGHIAFTIQPGTAPFIPGDYFEIDVVNIAPTIDGLALGFGYDLDQYDDDTDVAPVGGDGLTFFYDSRLPYYDVSALNLLPIGAAINDNHFWMISALNATTFSVVEYSAPGDSVPVATYANATVGVPYNNGLVSFTIPIGTVFIVGDVFTFTVNNPSPYATNAPIELHSKDRPQLILFAHDFLETPASTWTVTFLTPTSVQVEGKDLLGVTLPGYPITHDLALSGYSYKDDMIHYALEPGPAPFLAGDVFTFEVFADKPTYLVWGTVSGWQPSAEVGKWYWNGKIGFKIPTPYYTAVTTGVNVGTASLTLLETPRSDSVTERYDITCTDVNNTGTHGWLPSTDSFRVESDIRGHLQGATLMAAWTDGNVEFQVNAAPAIGDSFQFLVQAHKFPLFHAHDLVIFKEDPPTAGQTIVINKALKDHTYLKLTNTSGPLTELDRLGDWMPIYEVPDRPFSDEPLTIDLYSTTIPSLKVGTLAKQTEVVTLKDYWTFTTDAYFTVNYLPLNASMDLLIMQGEMWRQSMHVKMTEQLWVGHRLILEDFLTITLSDDDFGSYEGVTIGASFEFEDFMNISIADSPFFGFLPGYDTFDYDAEPPVIGLPPGAGGGYDAIAPVAQTFGNSARGLGIQVSSAPVDVSNASISEGFVMIVKTETAPVPSGIFTYQARVIVGGSGANDVTWTQPVNLTVVNHSYTMTPSGFVDTTSGSAAIVQGVNMTVINSQSIEISEPNVIGLHLS